MNKVAILEARAEATRFIRIADKAIEKIDEDHLVSIVGSKETSAVRRASMDLTRTLAEMRR